MKIRFPLNLAENDYGLDGEFLSAVPLGDNEYVIDNPPFHVYGVSYKDIVYAKEKSGVLTFGSIIKRGGHSTYRIRMPLGQDRYRFLTFWEDFEALGCSYEEREGNPLLYAIDVPPGADVTRIYSFLLVGSRLGAFEFEEAFFYTPKN